MSTYYEKNREARKEYQREFYRKNREKILRGLALKKHLEPEKAQHFKQYNREYYLKNREKILAARRAKYAAKKQVS